MTTIAKTYSHSQSHTQSTATIGWYDRLVKKLEFNHFSLIAMTILIGSCLGGIAAMFVFQNGAPMWQFLIGLGFAMANLVASIAQVSTRWVLNLFLASIAVNASLLLINLI